MLSAARTASEIVTKPLPELGAVQVTVQDVLADEE
jgi:hypothetical protein